MGNNTITFTDAELNLFRKMLKGVQAVTDPSLIATSSTVLVPKELIRELNLNFMQLGSSNAFTKSRWEKS
ncbi:MAG: hypothetical protein ACREGB_00065 [Candidatus Saccharimonadales bacterium]